MIPGIFKVCSGSELRRTLYFQLFTLFLASYTVFAQPNLPACWLEQVACGSHPHPGGHADQPHSHEYLYDSLIAAASGLSKALAPVEKLLELLRSTRVGWYLRIKGVFANGDEPVPSAPPPRLFPF